MKAQHFVGMSVDTARMIAIQNGFQFIVKSEGPQTLNNDFVQSRLTVTVSNGSVIAANFG